MATLRSQHVPPLILDQIGAVLVLVGAVTDRPVVTTSGVVLLCVALAWHVILLLKLRGSSSATMTSAQPSATTGAGDVYADRLVRISSNGIVLLNYYFPTSSGKRVAFADIEHIRTKTPTVWNGKWRIWGTGDLRTWFPLDDNRPRRDRIFLATLRTQWVRIGFTVEDSTRVETIFTEKGLLQGTQGN